jgi:classical protein kinase C
LKKKAIELRQILKDRNAQLQCDTQIRESQRYIDYFTEELKKLQTKGSRASFVSMQPLLQSDLTWPQESSTATNSNSMADTSVSESPTHTIQSSYFPQSSTPTSEEDEAQKRYTNLGKIESEAKKKKKKKMFA